MDEVRESTAQGAGTEENATADTTAGAAADQVAAKPAAAGDIATGQVEARNDAEAVGDAATMAQQETGGAGLDVILHIPVTVQVVLGRAKMPISRLMSLGPGAVVPLDRKAGEPVEVVVNGRLVARGEVVLLDDGVRFGISLTEIVEPGARTC